MKTHTADFDIVVIGGGHAGVEAALAAVRMGRRAAIVTMDPQKLALMSCNPAIGGIGKSQLVKEVDALGGLMGVATDGTGIQFRRLNLSRGPAVWSTRAQADRIGYNAFVVEYVAKQKNLEVIDGVAGEILVDSGRAIGVRLEDGRSVSARAVVVASGTFLGGLIHIGEKHFPAGRIGEQAAYQLSESFRALGFEISRLKTGTPPRLDGRTIDWSVCEIQPGDEPIPFFSSRSRRGSFTQTPCHLTATSEKTREIIDANKHRSPIFSGQITSRGPRYCPSIEDKFHRFADKPKHHIFLEPEGNGTDEVYPNGFSTALPEEVQREAIRTVIGLEGVTVTRPGYAVEYDYCPSHQIKPSLETRRIQGLFFAGQINGTSGYEEAAAQGIMAGINAALYCVNEPAFILDRSEAYIGVMIDDLITRSITEPYRMFTSRAEYRLALREDNARDRLNHHARRLGLISDAESDLFLKLDSDTRVTVALLAKTRVKVADLNRLSSQLKKRDSLTLAELIRQPDLELNELLPVLVRHTDGQRDGMESLERAAIQIRYQGYIDKQQREIDRYKKLEHDRIPSDFVFQSVHGLKTEAREKLSRFRPVSVGQAGRIEGVTPSDMAVLSVYLKRHRETARADK
ncbi:MAG: tRNA uridine-5-carboxymethylaminomethyl(34) synthesis enzyme MnmG [candidate division Zixibacteria bacterium]|nr:tRNA uridine-5-carboxymethylaminomethyl(34) synthesis enzyme MnmG [candidate division Zixibacteria bacterium]